VGSGHSHGSDAPPAPADRRVRLLLGAALAPFAVAVAVGLVALWPHDPIEPSGSLGPAPELLDATVVRTELRPCASGLDQLSGDVRPSGGTTGPRGDCSVVTIRPDQGSEQGQEITLPDFAVSAGAPDLRVGDTVVVGRSVSPLDLQVQYYFADIARTKALWILAAVFAVMVTLVARWKGVTALVGLVFTFVVLVVFVLPGLLAGKPPLAVALVGSGLIMFVVLYLAHGVNVGTSTALLGTLVSLLLTGLLAVVFVNLTRLSGLSSEEASFVKAQVGEVDLQGLLLAGMIIGALGVLNDVTVTQASAAFEIHAANPSRGGLPTYRSAMRVGRDHIASVVDTLVLAYAGASLPLLILFSIGDQQLSRILSSNIVAEEIVRTLVGSMGLVASVPITTALAASVAATIVASEHGSSEHGSSEHGSSEHGSSEHGSSEHGSSEHGSTETEPPIPAGGDIDDSTEDDDDDGGADPDPRRGGAAARRRPPSRQQRWQPPKAERDFWES
jgi:uncharacterized membrane protein